MSFSQFHHCPQQGHIDRINWVCGYIQKYPKGAIRFCTGIKNHESVFGDSPMNHDRMEMVYGSSTEEIPQTPLKPKATVFVQ